ncbi:MULTISPECIES: hypothetical protein [unclassified Helicobacter]|uniref:hypothetical protein n=1 Tax=unclassified Helicobacter TaxID=2593540 RepID=UPI000CF02162|nr:MULTISPECIES: hypothetical protein [unclassified Helicobacter]
MKKTFWPFGILLIILFGICLLVALVYISLIQPNLNDNSYMQKYRDVDKNINVLLEDSKIFLDAYEAYLSVDTQVYEKDKLLPPYLIRAKKIGETSLDDSLGMQNKLYFSLVPKQDQIQIKILQYQVFATRYYDKDYNNRADLLIQASQLQSFDFNPTKQGRYKIIVEITFLYNQRESKVFLQRDFIVKN